MMDLMVMIRRNGGGNVGKKKVKNGGKVEKAREE